MNAPSQRSYTSVAIAIVVAGVLISASLFLAIEGEVRTTTSTATVTLTSTVTITTEVSNGSFSFSPASPVRIDDVQALLQQYQGGPEALTFTVAFTNIGSSPIDVVGACFSPLEASPPANSTVVESATGTYVQCEAITCTAISPAQSSEASSDSHLVLVNPGTVTMTLTLYWGTSDNSCIGPNGGPYSTSISATFSFS